jgi:hypothetical protein
LSGLIRNAHVIEKAFERAKGKREKTIKMNHSTLKEVGRNG